MGKRGFPGCDTCTAWSSCSSRNSNDVQQARSTSTNLTKETHLMTLSGKQSTVSIPTHATPSTPNTHWKGAPEAGKLCVRLLRHRLVTLPHSSSGLSCPRHHTCPSNPGAPHSTSQHLLRTGSKRKQQRNAATAKNCLVSSQSSSCTHQITQVPARRSLSTDQHIWLCRE